MAKVKQPLLSFDARRKLGDDLIFKRQGRTAIVETRPHPVDARSVGQLSWRHMFQKVVALWHALSTAEKEAWESLGRKRHMTGYAWFISQALRPNPGIYLPLQGGIMQGDIDMASNRLLNLIDPTAQQEPVTKQYFEDNKYTDAEVDAILAIHTAIAAAHHAAFTLANHTAIGDNAPHHARYTDAEVDAILAIHTAIAAAHHARYADAEAVTAAKTVKLDDFTTPDDNADLNASITRHGLLKKLPNNANQFLNGVGNWIVVTSGYTAGARVINSGALTIPNATVTALTFDTERYDTDGIHSVAANTSRLTCKTAGKYVIMGQARWTGNATGARILYIVHSQGADPIAEILESNLDATVQFMEIGTIWDMAVNEYVEFKVFQSSGGNLDVMKVIYYSPEFMMQRIG